MYSELKDRFTYVVHAAMAHGVSADELDWQPTFFASRMARGPADGGNRPATGPQENGMRTRSDRFSGHDWLLKLLKCLGTPSAEALRAGDCLVLV